MVEEWVKNARGETKVTLDARAEMETELGALKEKYAKLAEQLKAAVRSRDSAEAGLKTTERQFEEVRKELHYFEVNLATEKQMVTELCKELRKARETAQLFIDPRLLRRARPVAGTVHAGRRRRRDLADR